MKGSEPLCVATAVGMREPSEAPSDMPGPQGNACVYTGACLEVEGPGLSVHPGARDPRTAEQRHRLHVIPESGAGGESAFASWAPHRAVRPRSCCCCCGRPGLAPGSLPPSPTG